MRHTLKPLVLFFAGSISCIGLFTILTLTYAVRPPPGSLSKPSEGQTYADILDRHGYLLSLTKKNRLNHKAIPLWKIPELLAHAFVLAEDKRFYVHHGVDWLARGKACLDNIRAGRIARGASTITEQCIRILHPRPRTFFTRWVETLEAYQLEGKFSKDEILEFYLNQVPFSHQCRGVLEASDFYFGRTLDTLNIQEMLALAVMVRAPSLLSPLVKGDRVNNDLHGRVRHLAARMKKAGLIPKGALQKPEPLDVTKMKIHTDTSHFVRYIKTAFPEEYRSHPRLITTIDGNLQTTLHQLLRESLKYLKDKKVHNGAILVLDHQTDEILAWVNGSEFSSSEEGSQIDAVLTLRQPGSALKPFLYALALENGHTAASIIPDIPLLQPVGHGLHHFKNYSSQYYGPVRLRCALGNSLNVPAIRTIKALGVIPFRNTLRQLGFESLQRDADYYGEGLALGNGEVSLFELVRAYSVLARSEIYREPKFLLPDNRHVRERRIFSPESCSIIANILSDPYARLLEFGGSGLLDFPVQTAVKTGTSTDYRDAWAIGFNYRYTVGVWMGNLDYRPMDEITGSRGPALVLRSAFHELNQHQKTSPLFLSRSLQQIRICTLSGKPASPECPHVVTEWFRKEHVPQRPCNWHQREGEAIVTRLPYQYQDWIEDIGQYSSGSYFSILSDDGMRTRGGHIPQKGQKVVDKAGPGVRIVQPVAGLHIALDPRIPDDLERFPFMIEASCPIKRVEWFLDNERLATTGSGIDRYLWYPNKGFHTMHAKVTLREERNYQTPRICFWVK